MKAFGMKSRYVSVTILMILFAATVVFGQSEVSLLLQQSPADGGSISPGIGVHSFGQNSEVTISAVPKPGYQFVYWIGDVSEPTSSTTSAYLNSPKIVVAVYERIAYESLDFEAPMPTSRPGGGGGTFTGFSVGGGSNVSSARAIPDFSFPEPPEQTEPNDLPVPDQNDDFVVPGPEEIPEPATLALFSLAGAITVLKRRKR